MPDILIQRVRPGLVMVVLPLFLAGCCSGVTTDPRGGGLAGGVCGQMTGAYDARLQSREAELAGLADARGGLEARLNTERSRASGLGTSIASLRRQLDGERRSLHLLETRVRAEQAARDTGRAEHAALQAELADLDRELAGLIDSADQQASRLDALQTGRATAANERQIKQGNTMIGDRRARVQERLRQIRSRKGDG